MNSRNPDAATLGSLTNEEYPEPPMIELTGRLLVVNRL
jgi:hypothetical protein